MSSNYVLGCVMLLSVALQVIAVADEVRWLRETQRPPQIASSFNVGRMKPLLARADGTLVATVGEWSVRRNELAEAWDAFLGPSPTRPVRNEITVIKSESLGDVTRTLIRYECETDLFVEAILLRPTAKSEVRRPGLVALHHTTPSTFDETAGVSGPESLQLGLKMARRGFVVICPQCFLWQDAPSYLKAVESFRQRHPKSLGMRKMLFDAERAVDILAAQPDVDPKRLGAIGHSLGAKEVLYLTAFDQRIVAAVASEGGTAFNSTNWDASWYLGESIHDESFGLNHHELLALVAPRALLIVGGESGVGAADGDRSWPLIAAALPVHEFTGRIPRLGLFNHHQGHTIPDEAFERMAEWLDFYTK